ncbi:MAG: aldehyde dehydrogenase family protein [Myxococcota bacterium]
MLDQATQSDKTAGFGPAEAAEMVETLRKTFRSGKTRPLAWRKQQLHAIKRMIEENEEAFTEAIRKDMGRSAFETTLAETGYLVGEVKYTLKHLDRWAKPKKVKAPMAAQPGKAYVQHEPLGVVLNIAPWNYPLQLALAPAIGAISAGNCVVIKPSEISAHTSAAIAEHVPKYLDADAVRVVEGAVPETQALLEQQWDHIMYTGNGGVARIIMEAAAKHLTPVTLELGGKSPVVVDRNVDLDVAARRIVWGKWFNAGQTCLAPDYVLVHKDVEQPLLDRLRGTIQEFYGEDPKQSSDYPRIINDRHFERLSGMLSDGEVVAGGQTEAKDRYIAPTVLKDVPEDAKAMQEEIFGPILPVVSVPDIETAIEKINSRPKPLGLYVFTKDSAVADKVLTHTSSGGACVNEAMGHFSCPELPFGGVGPSGMGAYHGRHSFETFSHQKAVLDKKTWFDPPQRYAPYDEKKLNFIKKMV